MTLSIDQLYAFIAVDEEGEGIAGMTMGSRWVPFVGADMKRVDDLRPFAQRIARVSGKRIVVARFSAREDLEIIEP